MGCSAGYYHECYDCGHKWSYHARNGSVITAEEYQARASVKAGAQTLGGDDMAKKSKKATKKTAKKAPPKRKALPKRKAEKATSSRSTAVAVTEKSDGSKLKDRQLEGPVGLVYEPSYRGAGLGQVTITKDGYKWKGKMYYKIRDLSEAQMGERWRDLQRAGIKKALADK